MCEYVRKIVRMGQELLLGMSEMFNGSVSILDIKSCKITNNLKLIDVIDIYDIIVLDTKHFLLAAQNGVFRATMSEVINQSFTGKWVNCICHVTDSVYLLSLFYGKKLIVWNEQTGEILFHVKSNSI
jgi:hypothetical protein